jgi:hypothetical protein
MIVSCVATIQTFSHGCHSMATTIMGMSHDPSTQKVRRIKCGRTHLGRRTEHGSLRKHEAKIRPSHDSVHRQGTPLDKSSQGHPRNARIAADIREEGPICTVDCRPGTRGDANPVPRTFDLREMQRSSCGRDAYSSKDRWPIGDHAQGDGVLLIRFVMQYLRETRQDERHADDMAESQDRATHRFSWELRHRRKLQVLQNSIGNPAFLPTNSWQGRRRIYSGCTSPQTLVLRTMDQNLTPLPTWDFLISAQSRSHARSLACFASIPLLF